MSDILLFAATHPDRTAAMVIIGTYARIAWAPDYPYGTKPDEWSAMLERMDKGGARGATERIRAVARQ